MIIADMMTAYSLKLSLTKGRPVHNGHLVHVEVAQVKRAKGDIDSTTNLEKQFTNVPQQLHLSNK